MSSEIVSAVQDVRHQLTTELEKPGLSKESSRTLQATTAELDAATARLMSLEEIDWSRPDLAQRTEQIEKLASSLRSIQDVARVISLAAQVVSLVGFVLAHVEPNEPWPRK